MGQALNGVKRAHAINYAINEYHELVVIKQLSTFKMHN